MSTDTRLGEIGDELEQLFAADLRGEAGVRPPVAGPARRRSWFATRRRRWLAVGVLVIAIPGVAYAAGAFTSPATVARSLPAGARIFGSTPTCTVVRPDVEYLCTLAQAPPPDPVTHLTPKQWRKFLATPPNLGKVKIVTRRYEIAPGKWTTGRFAEDLPRIIRITQAYRDQVLAGFGFTPAQVRAYNEAVSGDTAGIGAGQFKGTVEPTVIDRRIDGGCRAINGDGTRWDCYLGEAAVRHKVVAGLGTYVPGPGVG